MPLIFVRNHRGAQEGVIIVLVIGVQNEHCITSLRYYTAVLCVCMYYRGRKKGV